MNDGCPRQLELGFLDQVPTQRPGEGWRSKSPSRWTRKELRAYNRRAKQAGAGDGDAQREVLHWLDTMLHQDY